MRLKIPSLLVNISLILGGLLLALLGAEMMARWLGPPYPPGNVIHSHHQCDPYVGWRGAPRSSVQVDMHGYDHQVTWNSQGMHDDGHTWQKPKNVFRILLLGDSIVEAVEVTEQQTSHQILEDRLNAIAPPGLHFEVISGAILAWNPNQELLYFRHEGHRFDPDLVLVMWFPGNDLIDMLPPHLMTVGTEGGIHCFAPYFVMCEDGFDAQPWYSAPGIRRTWGYCSEWKRFVDRSISTVYYHSQLYQRLAAALDVYEKDLAFSNAFAQWLDVQQEDEMLRQAYQLTAAVYQQLAAEAQQIGAKTAFVIAPMAEVVYYETDPDSWARQVAAEYQFLGEPDPTLPNKVFTQMMTQADFDVLDLHPIFVKHLREGQATMYWTPQNSHWNVVGNQMVGEILAQWLVDKRMVPIE